MERQRDPESNAHRSRGDVATIAVRGVSDPECRRPKIRREHLLARYRRAREDAEVVLDRVAVLDSVLEEVAVAEMVVADVSRHDGGIRAVHGHAAIECLPDAAIADVLPRDVAGDVPVERIPRESGLLSHLIELDILD